VLERYQDRRDVVEGGAAGGQLVRLDPLAHDEQDSGKPPPRGQARRRYSPAVEIARKLQLRSGTRLAVVGVPEDVELALPDDVTRTAEAADADAVLAFVRTAGELDGTAAAALDAARADRLAWIAYPKAGQLGTELNRDRLAAAAKERGAQPVRQVSIDDVWSALRFRPL
jgi:hypothetical protein